MNSDEKVVLAAGTIGCLMLLSSLMLVYPWQHNIDLGGGAGLSFSAYSVHATVTMWKDGVKISEEYHAGSVTQLGLNMTFAKLTGNSTVYNMTYYSFNNTFISIGNYTVSAALNTTCTKLPGEWNRTSANMHDCTYNSFNLTAIFYPDTGPYSANCIGVNFEDGIGNGALFAYDTVNQATGIDDSYTVVIEFKISAS